MALPASSKCHSNKQDRPFCHRADRRSNRKEDCQCNDNNNQDALVTAITATTAPTTNAQAVAKTRAGTRILRPTSRTRGPPQTQHLCQKEQGNQKRSPVTRRMIVRSHPTMIVLTLVVKPIVCTTLFFLQGYTPTYSCTCCHTPDTTRALPRTRV